MIPPIGPPPTPDQIKKYKTIVKGEWYLEIEACSSGVRFLARNNEYSRELEIISKNRSVYNFLFGDYITRVSKAQSNLQKIINKRNTEFFFFMHSK